MSTVIRTHYHVHAPGGSLRVSRLGRVELADNGRDADARQLLVLAHGDDGTPYLILTSNGDDQAVAWINDDGDFELSPEAEPEWFESFEPDPRLDLSDWLQSLLWPLMNGQIVQQQI